MSGDALTRALLVAAAIAVVALATFIPPGSNDFWMQAEIGGLIWNSGALPRTALFPFTEARDFPFVAHEWLPSVGVYLMLGRLGEDGLLLVNGAAGLALLALAARLAHRLSGSLAIALAVAVSAMMVANYRHYLRPELAALLLLLVLLNLLVEYRARRDWRILVWAGPVGALWANCHGSFPVAPILAGMFALGAFLDRLLAPGSAPAARAAPALREAAPYAACAALIALCALINPYGAALYAFAWDLARWDLLRAYIFEWTPPFTAQFLAGAPRAFWAYAAWLAVCLALVAFRWRRMGATGLLLLAVFGALSAQSNRHIALFAYVSIVPVAMAIGPGALGAAAERAASRGLIAAMIAAAAALFQAGNLYGGHPYHVDSRNFTPSLIEYVASRRLQGNVFNSYELGAELVYRFYPALRPAIDSRVDAYGERYFLRLQALLRDEPALAEFLARYDVRYMLLLWPDFEHGVRPMRALPRQGWKVIFTDHKMVLLGRETPPAPGSARGP